MKRYNKQPVNINNSVKLKDFPLHNAANNGDLEEFKKILQGGAIQINSWGGQHNNVPAFYALGHHNVLSYILAHPQFNIEMQSSTKKTILHLAIMRKIQGSIDFILENKNIDKIINIKDSDGNTALHIAANKHDQSLCQKLLAKGAKLDIKDASNKTAHDIYPIEMLKITQHDEKIQQKIATTTSNEAEKLASENKEKALNDIAGVFNPALQFLSTIKTNFDDFAKTLDDAFTSPASQNSNDEDNQNPVQTQPWAANDFKDPKVLVDFDDDTASQTSESSGASSSLGEFERKKAEQLAILCSAETIADHSSYLFYAALSGTPIVTLYDSEKKPQLLQDPLGIMTGNFSKDKDADTDSNSDSASSQDTIVNHRPKFGDQAEDDQEDEDGNMGVRPLFVDEDYLASAVSSSTTSSKGKPRFGDQEDESIIDGTLSEAVEEDDDDTGTVVCHDEIVSHFPHKMEFIVPSDNSDNKGDDDDWVIEKASTAKLTFLLDLPFNLEADFEHLKNETIIGTNEYHEETKADFEFEFLGNDKSNDGVTANKDTVLPTGDTSNNNDDFEMI